MKNKNIILMYIIAFLQGMVFYASIATLYRTQNGITLLQMGIIESVLSILIMVFEIPWGILCDRIGYKKTLIVCNLVYFLSKIVFYYANSFSLFLLERICLAFVVAGLSGCDTALLYESTSEDKATSVFGKYHAFGTVGMILASIMFSLFIQNDLSKSGLWTIYSYGLAFIFTLFLDDVKSTSSKKEKFEIKDLSIYLKDVKKILLFVLVASLFTETTHTLNTFYNQLQYERVSIPIEIYGYLYMGITLCSLSSALVGKLTKVINERKIIFYLLFIGLITCITLRFTLNPLLSVLCIAVLTILEALFFPLSDTIFNQHVTIHRATTLSIYSMIMNMGGVMTNIIFGKCADIDITVALNGGCIFILISMILYCIWIKRNQRIE